MGTAEREALDAARQHQQDVGWGGPAARQARQAVLAAERILAASENESYAETIDLGLEWDGGAPLPHVVGNGSVAIVICRANETSGGSNQAPIGVSSSARSALPLLKFTFDGCASIRFGSPGDEVLNGHPLWGRGLTFYGAHVVHNSSWLADIDAIDSVHRGYRGPSDLTHYFFAFHDESFEALADGVTVEAVDGPISAALVDAVRSLTTRG